ncbi:MAG TPA: Spy/CpxP family protein refolding chaperone [Myxococcota bacterium]|nr:Spy/CpxP family protein refolding chaperone [Myxococcota bacterium]HQK49860.1 Spy/CpxP family protein refolding chaperone [Myxococcota bacterium]
MIKNRWTWMILAGLLASAPALAQECPCGRGPGGRHGGGPAGGPGGGPGRFFAACLASPELGLTADQKARLDALRDSGREAAAGQRQAIQALRREMHQALLDPKASPEEIRARAKALHDAMDQARDRMLDRMLEARAVLTPAQLGKMATIPACQAPRFRGPPDEE